MTTPCGVISLLTDFGSGDVYVGVVKAVILSRFPEARIVDLSHELPPQDVRLAGFWLAHAYRWFPHGTVHVAVVDPGVGSERAVVAAEANGHLFLAPDNGLLQATLAAARTFEVRRIAAQTGAGISATFHGRDVFAPQAAALAAGEVRFDELGPTHTPIEGEPIPRPEPEGTSWVGQVLFVDRFGNAITNIGREHVPRSSDALALVGDRELRVVRTYSELAHGECGALVSSFGTLELAQRNGDAATALAVGPGDAVEVRDAK